jgi:hypothetical protein
MEKLKMVEKFEEFYDLTGIELLKLDGLDDAVIGIDEHDMRLIYSRKKIIKILMKRNKWKDLEAREYFAFNIFGYYLGEQTPIFCLDDI